MNTWKRLFSILFALIFAFGSSFFIYQYLQNRESVTMANPAPALESVIVARHPLQSGVKLTVDDLNAQQWPKQIVNDSHFNDVKQLIGKTLRTDVIEDEPITTAKILSGQENLSTLIPDGMRAVAVSVRRSSAMAKILERGSVVDVIAIFGDDEMRKNTKVIAQAVRVLSVDGGIGNVDNDVSKMMDVVLLVTPRDADWIVYARNSGVLELVVRNQRTPAIQ